jgi:UDP-GlcNAc:undecaprenyl-phosphate/decaprenyl-phosphate GlcNAc-1-phosphate transferase
VISSLFALALFGLPLLLSLLAVPPVRRLVWRLDLIDRPRDGAHKSHVRSTPYGGGIAIWFAALVPLLFFPLYADAGNALFTPLFTLLACATLLFLTGLVDDWRGLQPLPRFSIQVLATFFLVATCPEFRLPLFTDIPILSLPLTALWIVALTNAFNFLDNMDGLSAGIAAAALIALGGMALLCGQPICAGLCLVLLGAVVGFLCYNFPPASIFMGDAGAFFLGFLVSGASLLLSNHFANTHAPLSHQLAPLLTLIVPLYDLLGVSVIRLKNGIPPWIGDKNHISHRLTDLGLSRRAAVLIIHAATLVTGLSALLAVRLSGPLSWIPLLLIPLAAVAIIPFDIAIRRRSPPAA